MGSWCYHGSGSSYEGMRSLCESSRTSYEALQNMRLKAAYGPSWIGKSGVSRDTLVCVCTCIHVFYVDNVVATYVNCVRFNSTLRPNHVLEPEAVESSTFKLELNSASKVHQFGERPPISGHKINVELHVFKNPEARSGVGFRVYG